MLLIDTASCEDIYIHDGWKSNVALEYWFWHGHCHLVHHKSPHGLTWDQTWGSVVKHWHLTTWSMLQP